MGLRNTHSRFTCFSLCASLFANSGESVHGKEKLEFSSMARLFVFQVGKRDERNDDVFQKDSLDARLRGTKVCNYGFKQLMKKPAAHPCFIIVFYQIYLHSTCETSCVIIINLIL